MTSDSLFLGWLEFKRFNGGCSAKTVARYDGFLQRLALYLKAEHGLDDVWRAERDHLLHFCGEFLHREGLSPRTRRTAVAAVRGFFTWLVQSGVISVSPAEVVEYPSIGKKLPNAASLSTAEKLLMAPDVESLCGSRDAAMMAFLIGGALRLSELVALNESNLQWYKHEGRDRLSLRILGKGGKERLVPMPLESILMLHIYLGNPELAEIDRTLANGDRVLFVSTRNRQVPAHEYHGERRRISRRSVQDMIKKHGNAQGLPSDELNPHALRHLFATELAENDENLAHIQALLGHSDPKTTEIYISMAQRKAQQIVDRSSPFKHIDSPVRDVAKRFKESAL